MWSGCSHLNLSVPRLLQRIWLLTASGRPVQVCYFIVRLYSSCCTGFLASGKLRKLAVYSGAEACSGETSTHSIFPKLWFSSAIFPMTLAKGIARRWKFSYIGEEKSCFHLLHASSLLRVFHPLTTLKSHR